MTGDAHSSGLVRPTAVLVSVGPLYLPAVEAGLPLARELGVDLVLVSRRAPRQTLPPDLEVVVPRAGPSGKESRLSPAWARDQWRVRVIRPVSRKAAPPLAMWLSMSSDSAVAELVAGATIVVALDRHAVYAAWKFGRRIDPATPVVYGVTEALLQLQRRAAV